jgi:hypothetical protein
MPIIIIKKAGRSAYIFVEAALGRIGGEVDSG